MGQGGRPTDSAGDAPVTGTAPVEVESVRMRIHYTEMERHGEEQAAGGTQPLEPGEPGRRPAEPASMPRQPEVRGGGSEWMPPPAMRAYIHRYFETLERSGS